MGTVYAKEAVGSGSERGAPRETHRPQIKLQGVRARVDRVHVDGLSRTKDDIVRSTVGELFHATDFEDVILRAHRVRRALDSMGCFRDIGVFIDVSAGPGATPDGLEVTFQVQELSRIVGGINTTVSENEGNLVLGVKLPNVCGRGERVAAEYSVGHRSTSNYSLTATKPFPHRPASAVLSSSLYQQNHEYPWSGYRLLDRGLLLELVFRTSPATKHSLQWEGLVRETSVLNKAASFRIRESSGPQMKSVVRHTVTVDHRDEPTFPRRGALAQFASEVAGLGGGVAHIKTELTGQVNVEPVNNLVLQLNGAVGVLHDVFGTEIPDHYFLGGPTSLRGFQQRGVGPHCDQQATGGKVYWACGLHAFLPLPFSRGRSALPELFRSHLFVNAGALASPEDSISQSKLAAALSLARISCGLGVAVRLGRAARLELNYCVPLRVFPGDIPAPGLQFGVGATFL